MRETVLSQFGGLGIIIGAGVIITLLFFVIRFFKFLISLSFIGFLGALCSYFVYDYIFAEIPVIACISFVFCIVGLGKSGIIGKIFGVFGTILSAYIILQTLGLFF